MMSNSATRRSCLVRLQLSNQVQRGPRGSGSANLRLASWTRFSPKWRKPRANAASIAGPVDRLRDGDERSRLPAGGPTVRAAAAICASTRSMRDESRGVEKSSESTATSHPITPSPRSPCDRDHAPKRPVCGALAAMREPVLAVASRADRRRLDVFRRVRRLGPAAGRWPHVRENRKCSPSDSPAPRSASVAGTVPPGMQRRRRRRRSSTRRSPDRAPRGHPLARVPKADRSWPRGSRRRCRRRCPASRHGRPRRRAARRVPGSTKRIGWQSACSVISTGPASFVTSASPRPICASRAWRRAPRLSR